jgi:dienelactone hydrolase
LLSDTQVVVGVIVAVFSGTYAIWNNRQKRLAERAASTGLSVIAPDDIARNTKSPNVVSSSENVIVKK